MTEEDKINLVERPKEVFEVHLVAGYAVYITASDYEVTNDNGLHLHCFVNSIDNDDGFVKSSVCAKFNADKVISVINIKDKLTEDEAKTAKEVLKCGCKNKSGSGISPIDIALAILRSNSEDGIDLAQVEAIIKRVVSAGI